ncbi:SDR family NAD(P)-dependent oxidoreductase [Bailinhaonella thermotolerans]|uniref:SDR family NAD(P)-dependent oxidoreductase n=1 Tax=Bailinhaonella thermotolerans TaxID=1070861 RepID=A0A3A4B2C2_9ACTN|nr:SDR family NAD(P)-dependent oxidoreductase [Bailinhaonella thermotolerans]RJL34318.1 SDR family NAD(P)-dependent oxidoreductase [Bailinhaonella thermotolerans]
MRIFITGATSGLGREVAARLARSGAEVLVHGRDPARIKELAGELDAAPYVADLASLDEVRRLAAEVRAGGGPIDVLVNNAGVGFGAPGAGRELSADGHELRFAVNYLAPVLLTRLLLPVVREAVVNVGSLGQEELDFADLESARDYTGARAYRRSKLALAMFTFDLADERGQDGVVANCLHPATFMDTRMVTESGTRPISTVDQGARATLRLIEKERRTGLFFDGDHATRAHPQAYDLAARARLREATHAVLGV